MKPHITLKDTPINGVRTYNDSMNIDDHVELYHVFINEGNLKVLFTVQWNDPDTNPVREFQVIKHDHLYLDGFDQHRDISTGAMSTKKYPAEGTTTPITPYDTSIVSELFKEQLDNYGIVINEVTVHNLTFFESVNFSFTDQVKLDQLYDMINEACQKTKYSKYQ